MGFKLNSDNSNVLILVTIISTKKKIRNSSLASSNIPAECLRFISKLHIAFHAPQNAILPDTIFQYLTNTSQLDLSRAFFYLDSQNEVIN